MTVNSFLILLIVQSLVKLLVITLFSDF